MIAMHQAMFSFVSLRSALNSSTAESAVINVADSFSRSWIHGDGRTAHQALGGDRLGGPGCLPTADMLRRHGCRPVGQPWHGGFIEKGEFVKIEIELSEDTEWQVACRDSYPRL